MHILTHTHTHTHTHTQGKAKSEGGTPVGSPRKWLEAEGERGEVLSSDEEIAPAPQTRPRQRSLKRKKNILSNHLSSEQLVCGMEHEAQSFKVAHNANPVLVPFQASLKLKPGANDVVFSVTTKFQVPLHRIH